MTATPIASESRPTEAVSALSIFNRRQVKPLDSISVGWAQLGGWKLKSGDKLRIRCGGYSADLNCEVAN
jgi:hypothetical protein